MEPGFIEEHPLMRRFPKRPDLLFLSPRCEDVLLHTQGNELLQMGGFGIVAAGLPLADGAAGDSQQVGQARLRHANARAQRQHSLPKGIVPLMIRVPRHERAPCLPRDPAAPNQECEATGKKHATFWRLTSPGTLAILRGVGCARGGSTLIGGSGAWRKTPDAPFDFTLVRIAHFERTREAVYSRPSKKSLEQPVTMCSSQQE